MKNGRERKGKRKEKGKVVFWNKQTSEPSAGLW